MKALRERRVAAAMLRSAQVCVTLSLLACTEPSPSQLPAETGEPEPPCASEADCPPEQLCALGDCVAFEGRRPIRDAWREELILPAGQLRRLIIGGTVVNDNFINRGDIEVRYVEGAEQIVVEAQRFTMGRNQTDADNAFARLSLWAYSLAEPQAPTEGIAELACEVSGADFCQLRPYYDGQIQPVRDGLNLRVTVPAGWPGALELRTADNDADDDYPDRGDLLVDGLAGPLRAELDSGEVRVRLAEGYPHYVDCPLADACVAAGLAPDCGCEEFSWIEIAAREGEAATITVDAPAGHSYAATLQSHDPSGEGGCLSSVDCAQLGACELDTLDGLIRGTINHPGPPALADAGVRVELSTGACAVIEHAEQPGDWLAGPTLQLRGDLRLCSGCL